MSTYWKLKCPSCGELMGDGIPYKTLSALSIATPDRFEDVPVAGYKYRCDCGCAVDVPTQSPAIVHQFESQPLTPVLRPEGAYDETKPSGRRTQ